MAGFGEGRGGGVCTGVKSSRGGRRRRGKGAKKNTAKQMMKLSVYQRLLFFRECIGLCEFLDICVVLLCVNV